MQILPNISRSKGNQAMKFGQLIDFNMKNIFLEKSYTKCHGQNYYQTLFQKVKVKRISGSIVQSFIWLFFVCQVEDYRNILKLSCRPLAFTSCKKTKRGLEQVSVPHVLDNF